jgi:hypothetical protein
MSKMSAQKRQLEKARQERAAAKRERRQTRSTESVPAAPTVGADIDQDEMLSRLAQLHRRFADGLVSLEDFERDRDDLVQRLRIE